MSNFQVNDIIRCYSDSDNDNIIFLETWTNGVITAIDIINNTISVLWDPEVQTLSCNLSNLNNFICFDNKICKKIADNDWVDKDGNRYNDAGIKQ